MNGEMMCGYLSPRVQQWLESLSAGELWVLVLGLFLLSFLRHAAAAHSGRVVLSASVGRTLAWIRESVHPATRKDPRRSRSQRRG